MTIKGWQMSSDIIYKMHHRITGVGEDCSPTEH
jgi:hypothetical protein